MTALNYISLKDYAKNPEVKRFRHEDTLIDVKPNIITFDFLNGTEVHLRFDGIDALVKVTLDGTQHRKVVPVIQIPAFLRGFQLDAPVANALENIPFVRDKILA